METDVHNRVGPYTEVYDHDFVVGIAPPDDRAFEVMVCLDCGYTTDDVRRFLHADCEREENRINQTVRELIGDDAIESALRD